jgi:hypothetical protein
MTKAKLAEEVNQTTPIHCNEFDQDAENLKTNLETMHTSKLTEQDNSIFEQAFMSPSHLTNLEWALGSLILINADLHNSASHNDPFSPNYDLKNRADKHGGNLLQPAAMDRARERIQRVTGAIEVALRTLTEITLSGEQTSKVSGIASNDAEKGLLVACEVVSEEVEDAMAKVTAVMGKALGYGNLGPDW